jgi:hypothetical protein
MMTLRRIAITTTLVRTASSFSLGIALRAMGQWPEPANAVAAPADPAQEPAGRKTEADQKARVRSLGNLKEVALAMHNIAASTDQMRFPAAAIRKDGEPLLSWRVAILPYLGQKSLYDKFHRDEPWNSPHNKALLNQMPDIYAPVNRIDEPRGSTYYQVSTGAGALFEDELGPNLLDIKDGTSNTFLVVEAGSPVPWTKPEDISFDKTKPLPKLGRQFDDGFHVAFADSAVRFLSRKIAPEVLRALITRSGGEIVAADRLQSQPRPLENVREAPSPDYIVRVIDERGQPVTSFGSIPLTRALCHVTSRDGGVGRQQLQVDDLAPGTYKATVMARAKLAGPELPPSTGHSGVYRDSSEVSLSVGETRHLDFRYVPFAPNVF